MACAAWATPWIYDRTELTWLLSHVGFVEISGLQDPRVVRSPSSQPGEPAA